MTEKIRLTSLADVPTEVFDRSAKALPIIRSLADQKRLNGADVTSAAAELSVCEKTIRRLVTRFRQSPDSSIRAILPKRDGPKTGHSRLDDRVEAVINDAINTTYLTREQPTIADLLLEIRSICAKHDLPKPSLKAIRTRLSRIPKREIAAKRKGEKFASNKYGPRPGTFRITGAYEMLQIDHAKCDVIVVDPIERCPIGRPWLTLCLDVASRCVAGYYLTHEEPSSLSSALCIVNSILQKETHLAERQLHFEWPCQGIPDSIHTDNGADFHSFDLARSITAYGIGHVFRPPGRPHYGGHIERAIGTFMRAMHGLPGTTFSNVLERKDYDSEEKARLTLDQLDHWLCAQINQYHHTKHRELQCTPLEAWERALSRRKYPLKAARSSNLLRIDFLPVEHRSVTREGVRLNNIKYWHSALSAAVGQEGQRLAVHYDPRDLSSVYIKLADGEVIEAKYSDPTREPITLWELKRARTELRKTVNGDINEKQIFEMIALKRKITQQAAAEKNSKNAQSRLARTAKALSSLPHGAQTPITPTAAPQEIESASRQPAALYEIEDWS